MAQASHSDRFIGVLADGVTAFAHRMVELLVHVLSHLPAGGWFWAPLAVTTLVGIVIATWPRFDYNRRFVLGAVLRIGVVVLLWQVLSLALTIGTRFGWVEDSFDGLAGLLADAGTATSVSIVATVLGMLVVVQLGVILLSPFVTLLAPLVVSRSTADERISWLGILTFVAFPFTAATINVAGFSMANWAATDIGNFAGLLLATATAAAPVLLFFIFTRRPESAAIGEPDARASRSSADGPIPNF